MTTLRELSMKHKGIMKKNIRPRCTITDPYEKFWPLLDLEKSQLLVDEMEKTISKENGKLKVNWFTVKKLPLDIRKCEIKNLSNTHKNNISLNLKAQRSVLKMGINEVSRCVEKDQIACCLIAEDVANCMIAKHLLFMTAAKKIPVLILPDMQCITKRIIGFSSAVLGLKSDVINRTEISLHNLYQTIIKLSNEFRNPYIKQIGMRELKSIEIPSRVNVNIDNYLLKKPREGRAFVPEETSNIQSLIDLSFIPIEKMVVEKQQHFELEEKLFEIPITTDLFSIDTKPTSIEDIGESVERKTKEFRKPLVRYHGLKIKKIKPNPKRKPKEKENS
ncbi:unnamed protein product [Macrosiphum euphorbiae]|uniref:Ribosomal protein eL8/eL30/eS12/Gadd45 domain-containing protein n=1 Tax=Macrosiphum euphorbiae TaxID=13131 RepID=A0AAV0VEN2_9HEMI|nr:unnamed protein product [Macrosiphum euphorbiae]